MAGVQVVRRLCDGRRMAVVPGWVLLGEGRRGDTRRGREEQPRQPRARPAGAVA